MKRHLLQKRMTICWIGIFLLLTSMMAKGQSKQSYPIYENNNVSKIATVTISQTTEIPIQNILTFTIQRGFKITRLSLNNHSLTLTEPEYKGDDCTTITKTMSTIEYDYYTDQGINITFSASFSFADIESPNDLKSIFINVYAPGSTTQSASDATGNK